MNNHFYNLLNPSRLMEVVDVGANPIDGDPPYKGLLAGGMCFVTGFEPLPDPLADLQSKKGINERYLPYAISDGGNHTLNICRASGMTSLYEPDYTKISLFEELVPLAEVIQRLDIGTTKLDDVEEIENIDFLKIDVQGAELSVFRSGRLKLSQAVAIQVEVSFITLYKNQPSFGEIDVELRAQGFIPHCFAAIKKWPIAPCVVNNNPRQALNQLLEADLVYVRDFSDPETLSSEQIKYMALISHYCYGSFDLALRCVLLLIQRGILNKDAQSTYLQLLSNR